MGLLIASANNTYLTYLTLITYLTIITYLTY